MSEVLEKYFNPENIRLAFYRVDCWTDKMVKDRVGIRAFGIDLDSNTKSLSEKICSGNYEPQRGFKFYVLKVSKTLRTKTLSGVRSTVERVFGVLKLHYGMANARYLGIKRNRTRFQLMCVAHNIKRGRSIQRSSCA
jgi:hypothetical protein